MVFTAGSYEVTMTAKTNIKGIYRDKKNSAEKAMAFMNKVCIWANEAAENYDREGYGPLAKEARQMAGELYTQIAATGYYNL